MAGDKALEPGQAAGGASSVLSPPHPYGVTDIILVSLVVFFCTVSVVASTVGIVAFRLSRRWAREREAASVRRAIAGAIAITQRGGHQRQCPAVLAGPAGGRHGGGGNMSHPDDEATVAMDFVALERAILSTSNRNDDNNGSWQYDEVRVPLLRRHPRTTCSECSGYGTAAAATTHGCGNSAVDGDPLGRRGPPPREWRNGGGAGLGTTPPALETGNSSASPSQSRTAAASTAGTSPALGAAQTLDHTYHNLNNDSKSNGLFITAAGPNHAPSSGSPMTPFVALPSSSPSAAAASVSFRPRDDKDKTVLNTTSDSRYQIIKRIGDGAFSSVYLVRRKQPGNDNINDNNGSRQYAMKYLICTDDRERLAAIRECETINSVQGHPNVIRLVDMFMNFDFQARRAVPEKDQQQQQIQGGGGAPAPTRPGLRALGGGGVAVRALTGAGTPRLTAAAATIGAVLPLSPLPWGRTLTGHSSVDGVGGRDLTPPPHVEGVPLQRSPTMANSTTAAAAGGPVGMQPPLLMLSETDTERLMAKARRRIAATTAAAATTSTTTTTRGGRPRGQRPRVARETSTNDDDDDTAAAAGKAPPSGSKHVAAAAPPPAVKGTVNASSSSSSSSLAVDRSASGGGGGRRDDRSSGASEEEPVQPIVRLTPAVTRSNSASVSAPAPLPGRSYNMNFIQARNLDVFQQLNGNGNGPQDLQEQQQQWGGTPFPSADPTFAGGGGGIALPDMSMSNPRFAPAVHKQQQQVWRQPLLRAAAAGGSSNALFDLAAFEDKSRMTGNVVGTDGGRYHSHVAGHHSASTATAVTMTTVAGGGGGGGGGGTAGFYGPHSYAPQQRLNAGMTNTSASAAPAQQPEARYRNFANPAAGAPRTTMPRTSEMLLQAATVGDGYGVGDSLLTRPQPPPAASLVLHKDGKTGAYVNPYRRNSTNSTNSTTTTNHSNHTSGAITGGAAAATAATAARPVASYAPARTTATVPLRLPVLCDLGPTMATSATTATTTPTTASAQQQQLHFSNFAAAPLTPEKAAENASTAAPFEAVTNSSEVAASLSPNGDAMTGGAPQPPSLARTGSLLELSQTPQAVNIAAAIRAARAGLDGERMHFNDGKPHIVMSTPTPTAAGGTYGNAVFNTSNNCHNSQQQHAFTGAGGAAMTYAPTYRNANLQQQQPQYQHQQQQQQQQQQQRSGTPAGALASPRLRRANSNPINIDSVADVGDSSGTGGGSSHPSDASVNASGGGGGGGGGSSFPTHTGYLCLIMDYEPIGDLCCYVLRNKEALQQRKRFQQQQQQRQQLIMRSPAAHGGGGSSANLRANRPAGGSHRHSAIVNSSDNNASTHGHCSSSCALSDTSTTAHSRVSAAAVVGGGSSTHQPQQQQQHGRAGSNSNSNKDGSAAVLPAAAPPDPTADSPLTESQLLSIAYQLASVLDHLHSQSPPVVHRDLKPENILIKGDPAELLISPPPPPSTATQHQRPSPPSSVFINNSNVSNSASHTTTTASQGSPLAPVAGRGGGWGASSSHRLHAGSGGMSDPVSQVRVRRKIIPIVVTDFGLAIIQQEHRRQGRGGGTRPYIAPESWKGNTSTASDVWGYGCVLYALATARLTARDVVIMSVEATKKERGFASMVLNDILASKYSLAFASFVVSLLVVDPVKRPTAAMALRCFSVVMEKDGEEEEEVIVFDETSPFFSNVLDL